MIGIISGLSSVGDVCFIMPSLSMGVVRNVIEGRVKRSRKG
jgi:hypothetical protein